MAELTAGAWNLDSYHSTVGFAVRHAAVSKVRGAFNDIEGVANVAENVNDSTVEATIKVASIDTRIEARDEHLRSADFFDVEQYPTIDFKSTSFNLEGDKLTIAGDLTLHGVTKPIELSGEFGGAVVDQNGQTRFGASLEGKISRKEFGMTWSATVEAGGALVGDKVALHLDVEFVQAEA